MDHLRSKHRRSSGIVVATLGDECSELTPQCNLMELTHSWERQNHVYVHFKSVTGTPRPKSLTVQRVKTEEKPRKSLLAVLKSIL